MQRTRALWAQQHRRVRVVAALLAAGGLVVLVFAAIVFLLGRPNTAPAPADVARTPGSVLRDADLQTILAGRSDVLAAYRLVENPQILVLDYPDLATQGQALNRIAALVEKQGAPRDRILSTTELQSFIMRNGSNAATFYFGHDYRIRDIARFFTLADADQIVLTAYEERLRALLLAERMMALQESEYVVADGPERALISFVQPQDDNPATPELELVDDALRETILWHEASHGEFFTNGAYRDYCLTFWRSTLTAAERMTFVRFLTQAGYDPANGTLMANEAQAFLMYTPHPRAFSADELGVSAMALDDLRARFLAGAPPTNLPSPLAARRY